MKPMVFTYRLKSRHPKPLWRSGGQVEAAEGQKVLQAGFEQSEKFCEKGFEVNR